MVTLADLITPADPAEVITLAAHPVEVITPAHPAEPVVPVEVITLAAHPVVPAEAHPAHPVDLAEVHPAAASAMAELAVADLAAAMLAAVVAAVPVAAAVVGMAEAAACDACRLSVDTCAQRQQSRSGPQILLAKAAGQHLVAEDAVKPLPRSQHRYAGVVKPIGQGHQS